MNRSTIIAISGFATFLSCIATFSRAGTAPTVDWTAQTSDPYPPTIAPAPNGGVYVTSTEAGTGNLGVVEQYSSTGSQNWRLSIGTLANATLGYNVQSDAAGNVYVAGETYASFNGPNQGDADIFLEKYSSNGTLLWGQQFGTSVNDVPVGLAVTPGGTTYVTDGPAAINEGVPPPGTYTAIHQYLSDGTTGWTASLNTEDATYPGQAGAGSQGTAIDNQGNIVAAFTNYTNKNNNIASFNYLSKTSPTGQVLWIKSLSVGSNVFGTAIDSANNIYIASSGLEKFDSSGDLLWNKVISYQVFADCVGADGTIYAAGYGGTNYNDGFIVAFDSNGNQLWSTLIAPTGGTNLYFDGITISGNELVASGLLTNGGYWSGNEIVALNLPEPGCLTLLLAGAFLPLSRALRPARPQPHPR